MNHKYILRAVGKIHFKRTLMSLSIQDNRWAEICNIWHDSSLRTPIRQTINKIVWTIKIFCGLQVVKVQSCKCAWRLYNRPQNKKLFHSFYTWAFLIDAYYKHLKFSWQLRGLIWLSYLTFSRQDRPHFCSCLTNNTYRSFRSSSTRWNSRGQGIPVTLLRGQLHAGDRGEGAIAGVGTMCRTSCRNFGAKIQNFKIFRKIIIGELLPVRDWAPFYWVLVRSHHEGMYVAS
jgi:hypothetical protein